jgi:hypothetical protein
MPDTATPQNLIARYLTVGGATVDITATEYTHADPNRRADCNGCGEYEETTQDHSEARYKRYVQKTTREIREWAQAHAEMCRAMPMESVSQ